MTPNETLTAYDQIAVQYAQSQQLAQDNGFSWNHDLVIPIPFFVILAFMRSDASFASE